MRSLALRSRKGSADFAIVCTTRPLRRLTISTEHEVHWRGVLSPSMEAQLHKNLMLCYIARCSPGLSGRTCIMKQVVGKSEIRATTCAITVYHQSSHD
jgi:hypothetical protein